MQTMLLQTCLLKHLVPLNSLESASFILQGRGNTNSALKLHIYRWGPEVNCKLPLERGVEMYHNALEGVDVADVVRSSGYETSTQHSI